MLLCAALQVLDLHAFVFCMVVPAMLHIAECYGAVMHMLLDADSALC